MAAAEYYTAGPLPTAATPSSPHQYPRYSQTSPNSSPFNHAQDQSHGQHSPPFHTSQQEPKPMVHFAQQPRPSQPHQGHSHTSQVPIPVSQHRPSMSGPVPPTSQPNVQPYVQTPSLFPGAPPQSGPVYGTPPQSNYLAPGTYPPQHQRPYTNANISQYSLTSGYHSDPEPHGRRHRRHDHKDNLDREIKDRPRKHRSRSTNADGWLGAAGGGLIGDMIFPGLGTVGGALAGWLGGKDFAKHRKAREEKREQSQLEWERKYRDRSNSDDRRDDDRPRRNSGRRRSEY